MSIYTRDKLKDQSGQTLVEFILLLGGIALISFTFMGQVNKHISDRWEKLANVLLEDNKQTLKVR